jgi:hypothetical protein
MMVSFGDNFPSDLLQVLKEPFPFPLPPSWQAATGSGSHGGTSIL